ncbi:SMAD/FHA domain-containing protein [Stachybotrys elegans]|uniref:RING-type E3 ubiquitin transferase n=1 Tax=Stachybotrys elegans TaxID=80388 RepID=A0A8K0SKC9_9HYPO|nr:SMAD/FHA domain-containing protein [Stachybotrys elegans]
MTRTRAATNGETASAPNALSDNVPSIRFSAYYDPRSTRPSLTFSPIARSLPTGSETIRVGRYSERDSQTSNNAPGNQPSAAPVGFKSKVVSRRHCEFWCEDGKWYIRDVKSSSGTFLNHIRLSPPSQESKAFPINDGDIVQLGIDFKGGEEMIFRCVKMRVELNRGWQNKINIFNTAALNNLRRMAKNGSSGGSSGSQDCSICLNSIQPCQSLFVAPCSHTWHFKCVRALLTSPQYPSFMCPNCRASADLEADVEDVSEEWEQLGQETEAKNQEPPKIEQQPTAQAEANREAHDAAEPSLVNDVADMTLMAAAPSSPPQPPPAADSSHTPSAPVPIKSNTLHPRDPRTPSPPGMGHEGPITPRNDAGPWVFDGSAGGGEAGDATVIIRSIDAAADIVMTDNTSSDTASR